MKLPVELFNYKEWCLVGPMGPHLPEELSSYPLIAVDGGGIYCANPVIWIGDGDSSIRTVTAKYVYEYPPKKSLSDLALALGLFDSTPPLVLHLWGFLGGRRDHEILNFGEVLGFLEGRSNTEVIFYDSSANKCVRCFSQGEWKLAHQGLFTLASLRSIKIKLKGNCEYPLNEETDLKALSSLGLSNNASGSFVLSADGPIMAYFSGGELMRSGYLDSLRGLAVIWMIIFHTCYDMRLLGMLDWNFSQGFWYAFPRVIAFTFLFCVGASLNYAHKDKINWISLKKRSLKLGLAALAVSLGTYLIFPEQWVYFGTLHCIFLGSILGALLVNKRSAAFMILIALLILQYGTKYDIGWVSASIDRPSVDFIPIYPWFWAILLGLLAGPILSRNSHLSNLKAPSPLKFLGTHSLKIYLIHQPVIFGTLWLISQI